LPAAGMAGRFEFENGSPEKEFAKELEGMTNE
jgi:hypothetical protein